MLAAFDADAFWSKIGQGPIDQCWPYIGHRNEFGYGLHSVGGKQFRAHRLALTEKAGPAPAGKAFALHACDNPPCCNPSHLRWGNAFENNRDRVERGRHHYGTATHCKRGHEFSGDNFISRNGSRHCRLCGSLRNGRPLESIEGHVGRVSGVRTGSAKLKQEDVVLIIQSELSCRKLGSQLGVSHHVISRVRQGHSYKKEIDAARVRSEQPLC